MTEKFLKTDRYVNVLVDPAGGDWSCGQCWVPVDSSMETCPECKATLIKPSPKPAGESGQKKVTEPDRPKRRIGARTPIHENAKVSFAKAAPATQLPAPAPSPELPSVSVPLFPEFKESADKAWQNGCGNCTKVGGTIFWLGHAVPPCSSCHLLSNNGLESYKSERKK